MEVMPGYKQTEVGVIPEDWELATLNKLTSEIGDGIHTTPLYSTSGEYFFINGNNIRDGRIVITKDTKAVDHFEFKKHRKNLGDRTILLSINGTIGNLALYAGEPVLLGKSAAYLNVKGDVGKLFVYHYLQTEVVGRQFNDGLTGTTIRNLSLATIRSTQIALPTTKAEQEAIADVLSKAEVLIESYERLIAKKRLLKKGVMQKLLRRKDGWVTTKLGRLGVFLKGSGVRKDESMSGDLPCVRYGEIYTKHSDYIKRFHSWISKDVAATARCLKTGDLLFAGSGETKEEIGKGVAFVDEFEAYAGGDIVILRPENTNSVFMGYYLNTAPINRQKASKGQGDAVVHISASALADIDITIPPLEEQTAIALLLSAMDAEIALLEAQLAKYRQLKQGLMQNLLTGRVRLVGRANIATPQPPR